MQPRVFIHACRLINNEKHCREISEHKIAVCEKTAGQRSGNSSDLDSASLKVLVPVNIFQFSTMKLKDIGTQHTDCVTQPTTRDLHSETSFHCATGMNF